MAAAFGKRPFNRMGDTVDEVEDEAADVSIYHQAGCLGRWRQQGWQIAQGQWGKTLIAEARVGPVAFEARIVGRSRKPVHRSGRPWSRAVEGAVQRSNQCVRWKWDARPHLRKRRRGRSTHSGSRRWCSRAAGEAHNNGGARARKGMGEGTDYASADELATDGTAGHEAVTCTVCSGYLEQRTLGRGRCCEDLCSVLSRRNYGAVSFEDVGPGVAMGLQCDSECKPTGRVFLGGCRCVEFDQALRSPGNSQVRKCQMAELSTGRPIGAIPGRPHGAVPDKCRTFPQLCSQELGAWNKAEAQDTIADKDDDRPSQFGHRRIGEAKNPGPDEYQGTQAVHLPWSRARPQDRLSYPKPHRPGFRDVWTPGFHRGDEDGTQEAEGTDVFRLVAETVHATSWGPLRKRLRATSAHVVFAQETKVAEGKRAEVSTWAINNGWKMIAAPAIGGRRGGVSAGVAIFARVELGIRFPPHGAHILEPGRAVAAIVEAPACRPFLAVSVYLRTGTGLKEENLATIDKVKTCLRRHGDLQCLIGGDMNTTPEAMVSAGCSATMGVKIIAPSSIRGTCRTVHGARVYDFFMSTGALADCIAEVDTVEGTNVRTHTPVQLTFQPRQTSLKKLALRLPEPLARERVYGPIPPPPA